MTGAADAVRSTELRRDSEGVVRHGSDWLALWADPDSVRSPGARARALADARRTARAERALAAAVRAQARSPALAVRFHDGGAILADGAVLLPELGTPPGEAEVAAARGAGDHLAAWIGQAGPTPLDPVADPLARVLEQSRRDTVAARHRPGVAANLRAFDAWDLQRRGFAHARLPGDLPLEAAMAVVLRGVLADAPLAHDATALRVWDRWVRTRLAAEAASLRAALDDVPAYAAAATRFIAALYRSIGRSSSISTAEPAPPQEEGDEAAPCRPRRSLPAEAAEHDAAAPPGASVPAAVPASLPPYRAFTTAHDRVVAAADLCGAAERAGLRARLDAETAGASALLARLAAQLQRRLLAQQRRDWMFDREDGVLDTARLDRVVTTPGAALAFKTERAGAFRDTVVSLLIDCSGSMRGRPILLAAIAADIAARALERCGVACEVLGFTTADFSGGDSGRDWARAGRPAGPGRLGDLRHIVIKSADAPWRAARADFGVLLLPGLLRENVDGEALAWAQRRLLARRAQRRVLVAMSDGVPAEAATLRANPPGLLDRHLDATIAQILRDGRVEVRAIGIRHDVGRHYPNAVTIDDAQLAGPALFGQLAEVFTPHRTSSRHGRQS